MKLAVKLLKVCAKQYVEMEKVDFPTHSEIVENLGKIRDTYKGELNQKVLYDILELEKKILGEKKQDRLFFLTINKKLMSLQSELKVLHDEKERTVTHKDSLIESLNEKLSFYSERINDLIKDKEEREQKLHLIETKSMSRAKRDELERNDILKLVDDQEKIDTILSSVNRIKERLSSIKKSGKHDQSLVDRLEKKVNQIQAKLAKPVSMDLKLIKKNVAS